MEKQEVIFEYFHGYESEQFAFYRIPKLLFTDSYFKDLSCDAKVLYGLMLDRMSLSMKNHWLDDNDRVYIIFTLEQVTQYMNCGRDKGIKILAELDTKKGIGLIERVKQGFGKPDLIYLKSFIIKDRPPDKMEEEPDDMSNDSTFKESQFAGAEKPTHQGRKSRLNQVGKADLSGSEKPTYRGRKSRLIEVGKADLTGSEKPTYQGRKSRLNEVGKTDPNYTNNNYTDMNDINPIYLSPNEVNIKHKKTDEMDEISIYAAMVKNNIQYDWLMETCALTDREYIDEIVELMVETISVPRDKMVIAGAEYPYQLVKGKLLKVDANHMMYILECLHNHSSCIRNIRAYLLACIFNAPSTINSYYRAEVNHDMYDSV